MSSIKEQFVFYKKKFRYDDLNVCEIILRQYSDEELYDKDKLKRIYNELIECVSDWAVVSIIKDKRDYWCN